MAHGREPQCTGRKDFGAGKQSHLGPLYMLLGDLEGAQREIVFAVAFARRDVMATTDASFWGVSKQKSRGTAQTFRDDFRWRACDPPPAHTRSTFRDTAHRSAPS